MNILEEVQKSMSMMRDRMRSPRRIYLTQPRMDALFAAIKPMCVYKSNDALPQGVLASLSGVPVYLSSVGNFIEYDDASVAWLVDETYETYNCHRIPRA